MLKNYVISLKNETLRREHISNEFRKQGIPFEFFDAITPEYNEIKAREFEIDLSDCNLTKGEIACALSHIALWRLAQENNLDYIGIFEDDIYLGENSNLLLDTNNFPDEVHIIKLEQHFYRANMSFFPKLRISNRKFYRLKSRHVGAAGYIVSKKGINYILAKLKESNLSIPIDDFIFDVLLKNNEYLVLQANPAICIQDFILNKNTNFKSALEDDRKLHYSIKKEKKKLTFFQKLIKEIKRPFFQLKYKKLYFK